MYGLAFLKKYLELLNNQFKNATAFLPFGLGVFFGQSNLATNSYPTVKDTLGENAEITGKDFDFMWS